MSANNPILPRLSKLANLWSDFEENSDSKAGIFKIKQDEYRMIETFYEVEQTEAGQVPSVFIRFVADFTQLEAYTLALFNELTQHLTAEENLETYKELGFSLEDIPAIKGTPGTRNFLAGLGQLAANFPDLDGSVVAFLNPSKNDSPESWTEWLLNLLELPFPEKVKIMLVDLEESPLFDPIIKYLPEEARILKPELDMEGMLHQLAGQGGENPPDDPGILYRQAFISLMQSSKPGKLNEAHHFAKEAIKIARAQGWPHLEVAVNMAFASALINNKKLEEAVKVYEKAVLTTEQVKAEDPALAGRLAAQSMMGIGAVFLQEMDYENAAKWYQQSAKKAIEIQDYLLALEGWRMTGLSFDYDGHAYDAWDAYSNALEMGEKLPEGQAPNSTLPFVGKALLELAGQTGNKREKENIYMKMETLVGPEWENKVDNLI